MPYPGLSFPAGPGSPDGGVPHCVALIRRGGHPPEGQERLFTLPVRNFRLHLYVYRLFNEDSGDLGSLPAPQLSRSKPCHPRSAGNVKARPLLSLYNVSPTSHTTTGRENQSLVTTVPGMDETTTVPETTGEPAGGQQTASAPRSRTPLLIAAGVVIVALFAASQVLLVTSLRSSQEEIRADFQIQLAALDASIIEMSEKIDNATTAPNTPEAGTASSGATLTPAEPAGFLPRFTGQGPDHALGMTMPTIEGFDAYSDAAMTIDPTDGRKRVWMIWAHWCPFCQEELPIVNAWWPESSANYPTVDLITVTTSIDPSRGNPLDPYLEAQQFTFPVLVDADTTIAAQMGVNAFPFWMVTNGDGTVLFRTAGMLHVDQMAALFAQLEQLDA